MQKLNFQWTVVGAGPAGIGAVGQLIDAGIPAQQIAWIDPKFCVGDFGTAWKKIMSNTSVESFLKVYKAFKAFEYQKPKPFIIERMKPAVTCPLMLAAEPLQAITNHLRTSVHSITSLAESLHYSPKGWMLHLASGESFISQKVILALGAEAMTLPYKGLITIPFTTAADPKLLAQAINEKDVVGVFGSYQSARTVAEHLAKTNAKKIIHFYRSERSFEQNVGSLPLSENVEVYPITPEHLIKHIPRCNKAIYAVGFKRRSIMIEGLPADFSYDNQGGKIAPGIYGLGIAFPEIIPYTMGRLEYKVSAVWPFMKHLKKIFPSWLQEPTSFIQQNNKELETAN